MILDQIIADRKKAVETLKQKVSLATLENVIKEERYECRDFKAALSNKRHPINIIAEVKRASPSKGMIREDFPYLEIAKAYERGGAAALSILTEPKYFLGRNEYLTQIKETVDLPILRKDFMIDAYQIYEAKAIGADAILLIVAALSKHQLKEYLDLAKTLALDALVEIHTKEELEVALEVEAEIIGINNRNLKDFHVDLATSENLGKLIPTGKVIVSESGILGIEDRNRLQATGVHALLIGESLVKSNYIEKQLQSFIKGQ